MISYRLQFIESTRFMGSSLSNLVNTLAERSHKNKCTDCNMYCLEYTNSKDDLIE